jgi:LPXTG-site transpeptidase (sortase) family protein
MTSRNIRHAALRWLERMFFLVGGVLALWCLIVILRAEYYARMPVPEPPVAPRLAGEDHGRSLQHSIEPGSWVARLEAPSVELAATVLEGSDDATLARAAGHIENTAFPGERGNVGIAGHRDTIFRPLRDIRVGDPLVLTTGTRVLRYRVSDTSIVNPEDVYVLNSTEHPEMTLVTCYPFEFIGHAPRRFIVRADLVGEIARSREAAREGADEARSIRAPSPIALLPSDHHREKSAVVPDLVVVHAQHQRAVRSHPDRLRARPNRKDRAVVAHSADQLPDRHPGRGVGGSLQRVIAFGARGLGHALTKINPARRAERD